MRSVLPLRQTLGAPIGSTVISLAIEVVVALAQGGLAVSLGALARFLGSGSGHAADGAGMTPMSRVWSALPTNVAITSATGVATVGLLAVAIRGGAHILLEARETRDAAMLAAVARRGVLAAALDGSTSGRSIGAAVTWPSEVEAGARAERARLRAIVHLAVLALVIVALDAALAAIVVALLLPFAIALRPIRRRLRAVHERASRGAIETIDASRDLLEHAPLWATCGGAAVVTARVDALSREGAELAARAARGRSAASLTNELLAALAIVLLVALFGGSPRPALVAVLVTLVSAYRPIRDFAESSALIDRGVRASSSIGVAAVRAEAPRRFAPAALRARALAVDVGSARARGGIDLDVAPGEVVAIVGAPGTGKSALLEAIAGVRSSRGTLHHGVDRIDGAPVGPAHRPIAWVPPSPPVLPGSLAENLAPDAPDDAARISRAREILRALGDETIVALGDDERLGPRGRAVSSGEAQRIALARAIASDAPVLLLDEPTANLDHAGERRAIEVLRDASPGRSIVLVTHRPAPLALADRVVDLSEPSERVVGAPESERRIA